MSTLSQRALRTGIILGVLGVLAIGFTAFVVDRAGFNLINTPELANILTAFWQIVTTGFLPFSAALISASLVMRHIDQTRERAVGGADDSQPRS